MDFAEYAALARHLSELHRARKHRASQAAGYRAAVEAGIAQLSYRLLAQHQRLTELAHTFGEPAPKADPPLPVAPPPPGPPSPSGPLPPPGPPGQPLPPGSAYPVSGPPAPYASQTHPGGGLAYPELPAGPTRIALPATPVTGPGPRPVPAPTSGAGSWAPPAPRPAPDATTAPVDGMPADGAPADPGRELEWARQAADAADQEAMRAEALAARPALLPTWSPLPRALAVYLSGTAFMLLVQFTLVGRVLMGRMDSFSHVAWSFAGLPAVAFIGGFLVLSIWGKARVGQTSPPRYPRLGFLICFLGTPIGYCLTIV